MITPSQTSSVGLLRFLAFAACLIAAVSLKVQAWDYEGHRMVVRIAFAGLPTNFPGFALSESARSRVAFLSGEPDRWRNSPDLTFRHCNGPDHYIDFEDLEPLRMKPSELPRFRYAFAMRLGLERGNHPDRFPAIDASRNSDQTRELVGFLPWTLAESYAKLKSSFSYLNALREGGTVEEIRNAEENVLVWMGLLSHYVGDATQPLHTTKHFNGWVGENPRGYTTTNRFHSWIDGGFFQKTGLRSELLLGRARPAQPAGPKVVDATREDLFPFFVSFLQEQFSKVEPLYELERDGKLTGEGSRGLEGREFLESQLVSAGHLLGDLWFTAWQRAPVDTFLKSQLARRPKP